MMFVAAFIGVVIAASTYIFYSFTTQTAPNSEVSPNEIARETLATRMVDKSGQNLTELPREILDMRDVRELDLSYNQLSGALPAEIRQLSSLEILNVSHNEMTGVPAEIGQLTSLRILNLADNQLTGLPLELGNLQNLEILDLSGNPVSEVDLENITSRLPVSTRVLR